MSNAVYRLSLACFVFEISGGGGYPPPPVGTKVARTPVGARVKTKGKWSNMMLAQDDCDKIDVDPSHYLVNFILFCCKSEGKIITIQ